MAATNLQVMESKKFRWRVTNFSKLKEKLLRSDPVDAGGYKWSILLHPIGRHSMNYAGLEFADGQQMPGGWSLFVDFSLHFIKRKDGPSEGERLTYTFNEANKTFKVPLVSTSSVKDASKGFLINDTLVIEAEISVVPRDSEFNGESTRTEFVSMARVRELSSSQAAAQPAAGAGGPRASQVAAQPMAGGARGSQAVAQPVPRSGESRYSHTAAQPMSIAGEMRSSQAAVQPVPHSGYPQAAVQQMPHSGYTQAAALAMPRAGEPMTAQPKFPWVTAPPAPRAGEPSSWQAAAQPPATAGESRSSQAAAQPMARAGDPRSSQDAAQPIPVDVMVDQPTRISQELMPPIVTNHFPSDSDSSSDSEDDIETAPPPSKAARTSIFSTPRSLPSAQLTSRNLMAELSNLTNGMKSTSHDGSSSSDVENHSSLLKQAREKIAGYFKMPVESIYQASMFNEVEDLVYQIADHTADTLERNVMEDLLSRLAEFKKQIPKSLSVIESSDAVVSTIDQMTKNVEARLVHRQKQISSLEEEASRLGEEESKLEADAAAMDKILDHKKSINGQKKSTLAELDKAKRKASKELMEMRKRLEEKKRACESLLRAKEKLAQSNASWDFFKTNLGL